MRHNVFVYIAIMALTTYVIRVAPLTLIRKPIKSTLVRSFLYYVPYVTLAVMTFPAILDATQSVWSAAAALAVGVVLAWCGGGLFTVSVACCVIVFLAELFL